MNITDKVKYDFFFLPIEMSLKLCYIEMDVFLKKIQIHHVLHNINVVFLLA